MTKKISEVIVLAICALLAFSVNASAQMSDEAVYSYAKDAVAAGKSQDVIIKELAARGVTRTQAERIKRKLEETGELQEETETVATANRERTVTERVDTKAIAETASTAPETDSITVYGRDIFTTANLTFAPSVNLPTPENYVLGPGDEVIIYIWGTNEATIRQTISPDGIISIETIGLVNLNGKTVKEANSYMKKMLGRIYSVDGENAKSEIKLTLGNIRTIQVNVMGEVAVPGTYSISSLSNIFHAVYRAGGVSKLGTLRDIQLVRKGKKIASLDIYDFILNGKAPIDIFLQEGDVVLVPTYSSLVQVEGSVKRPMYYELKENENIASIINYAGGFTGNAYKNNLSVIRQNGREYQVYTVDSNNYSTFTLVDGDKLNIGEMLDRYENKLEIQGAVYRPGIYQLGNEIKTVKQLIAKADGLKGDAFTNRALLHRENDDLSRETIALDLKAIMNGSAADVELQKNDIVFIASIYDLKERGTITVVGEVVKPGAFEFAENTTIEDIIIQAGGLLESASIAKVDVSRRVKNSTSTEANSTLTELYTFSIKDGFVIDGENGFVLQPYDQVYVRRSPGYKAQHHVQVQGQVVFEGIYALSSTNERLSDIIKKAGGITDWAYVKGARLNRVITPEERVRMKSTVEMLNRGKDSIDVTKLELGNSYYVGIDLEAALKNPGSDADIVLREDDIIMVPELLNTVKISGNVMYPNVVSYSSNMSVKDFVEMAGGYGFKSKKNKAYIIYMNGQVARARQNSKKVVEPGCEIVIPQKRQNEGALQNILSIATTSASLATMIASITNLVK